MSVAKIFGFEDLSPSIDSALFETLQPELTRYYPATQTVSMTQRNGRQWCQVKGTYEAAGGYSVTRAASLSIELNSTVGLSNVQNKKLWVGFRIYCPLTASAIMQDWLMLQFGPGGVVPCLGVNELAMNTEYYVEVSIDYLNSIAQVFVNGTLFKTIGIPAWGPNQLIPYTYVVMGQYGADYNNNAGLYAHARVMLLNDIYVVVDDGVGLSGRLGGVKVRPLEIENVVLGEGWAVQGPDTPTATLSVSSINPTDATTKAMRSSTKHTDLVVDFKKPVTDDPVEFVEVQTFAFRDQGTATALQTSLDDRGVKTAVNTTTLPIDTLVKGVVKVTQSSVTPTGDRWTPTNLDTLKVVLNSKAGG